VLRETVHPYVIVSPNISVLSAGTPKKERAVQIAGNPGRPYGSTEERGRLLEACTMGSSIPVLRYHVEFPLF
jgi:hypothetical protein